MADSFDRILLGLNRCRNNATLTSDHIFVYNESEKMQLSLREFDTERNSKIACLLFLFYTL